MKTKYDHNLNAQSGLTMVELLVVIVVIAIVCTFALMQRGSANEQFQRQNVARELKVAFERARFDSVKRRATVGCATRAKVEVTASSFTLWTDTDLDGTPEESEKVVTAIPSNIAIGALNGAFTLPATVSYNKRGEPDAQSGGAPFDPRFVVCNGTCAGTPGNDNANIVLVTPSGTVNMLAGGAPPPTFGAPGGTAVNTSLEINDNLVLPPVAEACS